MPLLRSLFRPFSTLPTLANVTRNLAIIAHTDSGKTTLTERLLYYTSFLPSPGNVHTATTFTDYLPSEKLHGITITTASVTLPWLNHRFNLLDTPGHIDFGFEVSKVLQVLEGAVVVLDGIKGVESRTKGLWKESNGLVRLVWINKCDREGLDVTRVVDQVEGLGVKCCVVQMMRKKGIVVDLLEMEELSWSGNFGEVVERKKLNEGDEGWNDAMKEREKLIESVAELDDTILEMFVENGADAVDNIELKRALRDAVCSGKGVVVMFGSALKNWGVQPLMDAIVEYLPSPLDKSHIPAMLQGKETRIKSSDSELCALAFKVVYDEKRGPLVFVRVYSGKVSRGMQIWNSSRGIVERPTRVLRMYADRQEEMDCIEIGDIAVLVGLKDTKTGDTLVEKRKNLVLNGVHAEPSVFFCSVEAENSIEEKKLNQVLYNLQLEDPSFTVKLDKESGQTLLCGMGELHLEIMKERLTRDFRVQCSFGKMQVNFRETIENSVVVEYEYENFKKDSKAFIELEIQPLMDDKKGNSVAIECDAAAVRRGIESALMSGPVEGFPVMNVKVVVRNLKKLLNVNDLSLEILGQQSMTHALSKASCVLLEPVMNVEIKLEEEYKSMVLSDLSRRGHVNEIEMDRITAEVPLKHMMGYSSQLRSLTSGNGTYTMSLSGYKKIQ